jgi:phosphomannomutase
LELVRDAWPTEGEMAAPSAHPGSVTEDPTSLDRYVDRIVTLADLPSDMPKMQVVIDAGNGMAGYVVPKLLERCPWLKAECLYFGLDGNFPNHEANPLKEETLSALKKRVVETGAVCGVAFDGDADRLGFVDEKGELFRGDLLTSFFASLELRKRPGGIVLSDTRASWSLPKEVASAGGHLEWCKVGHANIKKMMRETGAIFSGELSMHFYFEELWNVESGDYAMLMMLKELAAKQQPLSLMRQNLTQYHHSGEINFTVKDTKSVLDKIKQVYASRATHIFDIDGLRYEFGDPEKDPQAWWLSVRSSNTEPLIRLNLEAVTKELMEQKIQEVTNLIQTA